METITTAIYRVIEERDYCKREKGGNESFGNYPSLKNLMRTSASRPRVERISSSVTPTASRIQSTEGKNRLEERSKEIVWRRARRRG